MSKPADTVLSVERALLLLQYLAEAEAAVGVRDLAHAFGYSPSVTQKLLNSLRRHRFVAQEEQTGRYELGMGVLSVGLAALRHLDVVGVAHPHLEALTEATGETSFLAVLDDLQATYVDKVPSPHPIRMDAAIGSPRPLNCTAVGKVLLAYGAEGMVDRLQAEEKLAQATVNSVVDVGELAVELAQVRERGFALDREEYHEGATCVAAPIFNMAGDVVAAITASGPTYRMRERLEPIAAKVQAQAAAISNTLGYRNSPGGEPPRD